MTSKTILVHDHIEITMKITGNEYADWAYWFNRWLHFFQVFNFERKQK